MCKLVYISIIQNDSLTVMIMVDVFAFTSSDERFALFVIVIICQAVLSQTSKNGFAPFWISKATNSFGLSNVKAKCKAVLEPCGRRSHAIAITINANILTLLSASIGIFFKLNKYLSSDSLPRPLQRELFAPHAKWSNVLASSDTTVGSTWMVSIKYCTISRLLFIVAIIKGVCRHWVKKPHMNIHLLFRTLRITSSWKERTSSTLYFELFIKRWNINYFNERNKIDTYCVLNISLV